MDSFFFHTNPEPAAPDGGTLKDLRIAIQPNISAAGWPTNAGSNALANFIALEDSTVVKRLRGAGARIPGSTRMSEFGFGLRGGEAGAAVSRKAVDAELVLDTMGESRLAAARAVVPGFKPSYGMVSRFGLVGLVPSMESCGILSADPKTIRAILETIAGPDERDFSLPDEKTPDFSPREIDPRKTTIGLITEAFDHLPADREKLFRASVGELEKAGYTLKKMSLPDYPLFSLVHKIVGSVEASSSAGRYDSVRYGRRAPGAKNWNEMYLLSRGAAFGPLVKSLLFQGAFFQFERYGAYEDACRIRARLVAKMRELASQADFLVFPAADAVPSGEPACLAEVYTEFAATLFANVTGQPVLYLPPDPGTRPAGLQFAGPRLCDARLLSLGERLMNNRRGGV